MSGSGLFDREAPQVGHLSKGEIADLRGDVARTFKPMAAVTVEEFTNLAASNTAGFKVATASTVAVQTATSFLPGAAGTGALSAAPRSIKFTTAAGSGSASDAPASCLVTGKDINGDTQTETVTLAQSATSVETVKCYSSLTSVVYAAGDGTGATVAIGVGTKVGFAKELKTRATSSALVREIIGGTVVQRPADVAVNEYTNPVASDPAGLHIATATTVAVQTLLAAALISGGKAALLANPRNVTFTTAAGSGSASDAPASALITGTDIDDNVLTESVTLAQSATIAQGVKAFKTIVSIVYAAGDGTGATVAVGFGKVFGLSSSPKLRAGTVHPIQELAVGAVVVTGTVVDATTSPPHGTYTPSANPDGSNDYAVYYEVLESAGSVIESAATSAPNGSYTPSTPFDGSTDMCVYYEYVP